MEKLNVVIVAVGCYGGSSFFLAPFISILLGKKKQASLNLETHPH